MHAEAMPTKAAAAVTENPRMPRGVELAGGERSAPRGSAVVVDSVVSITTPPGPSMPQLQNLDEEGSQTSK